ncbi:MAG: hypothetical protein NC410_07860 [Oscillibacter sp.]|nr:hypothetical protein [Oscillibacter sp.]
MNNLSLDKKLFSEIQPDVFLHQGVKESILTDPIFKYQNIAFFYQLLKGEIYIPIRKEFSDLHEHGECYNPWGDHFLPVDQEAIPADKARWAEEEAKRKSVSFWNALCFTTDPDENYFFWSTYTSKCFGIRFQTTIQKLIESIQFAGYELYIGKIEYSPNDIEPRCYKIEEYAFSKIKAYKDEKELRIYFLPKQQDNPSSLLLDITPEKMIEKFWLSPFMPSYLYSFSKKFIDTIKPKIISKLEHSKLIESKNIQL